MLFNNMALLWSKCVYDSFKEKLGYRQLYMRLAELMVVPMNHKEILRLMHKYNFFAKIRRVNTYKKIAKATQECRMDLAINACFICPYSGKRQSSAARMTQFDKFLSLVSRQRTSK